MEGVVGYYFFVEGGWGGGGVVDAQAGGVDEAG